jgi:hypothetical protein
MKLVVAALFIFLNSKAAPGAPVFCPTESEVGPLLIYGKPAQATLFVCGTIDDTRAPNAKVLSMTKFTIYGYKQDRTPYPVFDNDNEFRNFLISNEKDGMKADEFFVFDQKTAVLFSTIVSCTASNCSTKTKCLRPFHGGSIVISKKKLMDKDTDKADAHLREIFKSALGSVGSARAILKDKQFNEKLESPIRDLFERFQGVLKTYADLGC